MPEEGREGGGIGLIREGVVTDWCVRTKVKSAIYVSTPTEEEEEEEIGFDTKDLCRCGWPLLP